ncbi:hypothetical protein HanIR_Chr16g0842291 [Helianthus annuus]|nr:hypothetical protein HanIR_Chr16g0842291 [Helianthus annuus]
MNYFMHFISKIKNATKNQISMRCWVHRRGKSLGSRPKLDSHSKWCFIEYINSLHFGTYFVIYQFFKLFINYNAENGKHKTKKEVKILSFTFELDSCCNSYEIIGAQFNVLKINK